MELDKLGSVMIPKNRYLRPVIHNQTVPNIDAQI